jgi:hypothetical protein
MSNVIKAAQCQAMECQLRQNVEQPNVDCSKTSNVERLFLLASYPITAYTSRYD